MKIHLKMFFVLLAALTVLLGADSVCVGAVNFTVTPAAISNTYNGTITLQVTGLTSGDTVVVQKFLDANTNGAVGAGDLLVQQFDLTDGQAGMVIGGVTNINVPGDTDSTAGQITAKLNFPGGEFMQSIVGNYLFVLSSPVGHFLPVTNVFNVTNFPFAQKITGSVVSNDTSTTLPNSVVVFFPAPSAGQNGPNGNPLAGVVADNSGAYTIQLPPGTYVPMAFKSNCVANYSASPVLTLGISQTITTNLSLTIATASISGKIVDALNPGIGLPGLLEPAMNSSGFIGSGSSDTDGNFTIRVTSGTWQLDGSPQGLALHGYVAYNNGTNVNAGTTGFVGAFYQANALFYGKVKDDSGNPLPGIAIGASDNNNDIFYNDGYSDANGNYVAGAVGGLGAGDPWQVGVDNKSEFPNYLFSQSALQQNGGTNLAVGQAVQQKFTAILATNHITGNVQFNGTNVVGVQVYAFANINGNNYQAQMDTDSNGNYSLNVANGTGGTTWNVNVYDCGCSDNDSLNNILGNGNYQLPSSQNVTINNNNGTANFTISPPQPLQMTTSTTLPDGTVGMSYNQSLNASGGQPPYNWWLPGGTITLPPGVSGDMNFSSDGTSGTISGTPGTAGTFQFWVEVSDNASPQNVASNMFSITVQPAASPLQITTTYLLNGTNTTFYSQTLQASGGTTPYSWSLTPGSVSLPPNLTLATNGVLSGTLATNGYFTFYVRVTDSTMATVDQSLSLNVVNPPLQITTASLPNGAVGVDYTDHLAVAGGYPPYSWSLAAGSAALPANLTLGTNGILSGVPTATGTNSFIVQVLDSSYSSQTRSLTLVINGRPVLGSPVWQTNRFQMRLTGAANQNYTLQLSTNLGSTNWTSLFITNNATTNSFLITDPNATNKQRFYRVLIGP